MITLQLGPQNNIEHFISKVIFYCLWLTISRNYPLYKRFYFRGKLPQLLLLLGLLGVWSQTLAADVVYFNDFRSQKFPGTSTGGVRSSGLDDYYDSNRDARPIIEGDRIYCIPFLYFHHVCYRILKL